MMTPAEHYARATELLEEFAQFRRENPNTMITRSWGIEQAKIHALLATVVLKGDEHELSG